MSRARECFKAFGPLSVGVTFFPYQFCLGLSIRYWPCIFAPAFRIYIGPFKLWGYWSLAKKGSEND